MREAFRLIRGGQAPSSAAKPAPSRSRPAHFEEALIPHLDSLLTLASKLAAGERELAEDLVQETCLRAFRSYEGLRSPERFEAWLLKILVNTYINEFRRRNRNPSIVDVELSEAVLESASVASAATPESQFLEHLLDSEIQQALDALPVEFRAVVWLADVEELSYAEISEITECPSGTVASRLYRGHSLLREHLREFAKRRGLLKE